MVDVSAITYDALRVAAEHVLAKVREGKSWALRTSSSSTSAPS